MYTTSKHYNSIYLTDLTVGKAITELQLGKGFIGNVTSVGVTGRYLYVVLHYIKTVQVYDLEKCIQETCEPICAIDHLKMYALGLRYFSPLAVHSSVYHPSAIFIKTADSIIALDVSKECSPRLLTVIRPVPDSLTEFIFEVNANYLVVTTAPNIIQ